MQKASCFHVTVIRDEIVSATELLQAVKYLIEILHFEQEPLLLNSTKYGSW